MLKVGEKKLFIYDNQGQNHEMSPLCVLDFYVCEQQQRKGYGKSIFDMMLHMENARSEHIAIDRPSEKSVRFLKKHYNLKNPIPQVFYSPESIYKIACHFIPSNPNCIK